MHHITQKFNNQIAVVKHKFSNEKKFDFYA